MSSRLWRCSSRRRWEPLSLTSSAHVGIAEQTFYRWKQRYAGLESEQVRAFKQLQDENAKLKRLVADLSLDKVMLQDVLSKKF